MNQAVPSPTSAAHVLARVRAWLAAAERPKAHIAAEAGVDEKNVRLAIKDGPWNPTMETLQKLEALIPPDWEPAHDTPKPGAPAASEAA